MANILDDGNKVWVTASITLNLGNYESVKLEMGYNQDYAKRSDPLDIADTMASNLEELLQTHVRKLQKIKNSKKRKRDFDEASETDLY